MNYPTNQKYLHQDAKRAGALNLDATNLKCSRVLFPVKGGHQGRTRQYKGRNCKPVRIFRPLPKKSGLKFRQTNTEMNFMVYLRNSESLNIRKEFFESFIFGQPAPPQPIF